jgi:hypothetical protein
VPVAAARGRPVVDEPPAFRVMMPGVRLLLSLTCDRLGDPQHPQLADLRVRESRPIDLRTKFRGRKVARVFGTCGR